MTWLSARLGAPVRLTQHSRRAAVCTRIGALWPKLATSRLVHTRAMRAVACCSGHWGATSGDLAKFGLRCPEIVEVVDELTAVGMLDCLQLLHFHVGSQVSCELAVSLLRVELP